jgi:hypothetical protein
MLQRILAPGYCRGHSTWTPAADDDAPRTRDGGGEDAGWLRWLQLRPVCIGMYSRRVWETTDDAIRKFKAAAMASSQGRYSRPGEKESGHAGGTAEGQGEHKDFCVDAAGQQEESWGARHGHALRTAKTCAADALLRTSNGRREEARRPARGSAASGDNLERGSRRPGCWDVGASRGTAKQGEWGRMVFFSWMRLI